MFYSEGELTVESPGGLEQEKSRCKVVTGSSYGKMERQEVCVAAGAVRGPSGGRQEAVRGPSGDGYNHQNLKLCTFSIPLLHLFCAFFSIFAFSFSVPRSVQHCRISALYSRSSFLPFLGDLFSCLFPAFRFACALSVLSP